MNIEHLIHALDRFGAVLPVVVRDVATEDARWRPVDGGWSILEIVCHLGDEEVADFRMRLESTLRDPSEAWRANDPEAWAIERRYNEGELAKAVERFVVQRRKSIAWLRGLKEPDWSRAYEHPKFGPIRAGDILVSWAAHDALHLRQLAKRMFQIAQRDGTPYTTDYAGDWKA